MTTEDQKLLGELMRRIAENGGRAVLVVREDARRPTKECCVYSSFATVNLEGIRSAIFTLTAGITKLSNSVEL